MHNTNFQVCFNCKHTNARIGELRLKHGNVSTPVFLPVGSQGSIRSLTPDDLEQIDTEMILCNSYHLFLRPGVAIVEKAGGLHNFMKWNRPILTDSGGYQIFSLSSFNKIKDDGIYFRSHVDGSEHFITPELSIDIQEKLGADIIMALDICPPNPTNRHDIEYAVEVTSQWAKRCIFAKHNTEQLLFGIIQGGIYNDLRTKSAEQITSFDFSGYAIGGLSLGEPKSDMWAVVDHTISSIPVNKPRYLMGVGSPEDIINGVSMGIDVFDSALPTRVARNGAFFTKTGRINIKHAQYRDQFNPIDKDCQCYTCRNYTLAYLHHLFKCEELLAYRLATIHNLFFINGLINGIRDSIKSGDFLEFKDNFINNYHTTDEESRIDQKMRGLETRRNRVIKYFQ